jgi:hypothetical protein
MPQGYSGNTSKALRCVRIPDSSVPRCDEVISGGATVRSGSSENPSRGVGSEWEDDPSRNGTDGPGQGEKEGSAASGFGRFGHHVMYGSGPDTPDRSELPWATNGDPSPHGGDEHVRIDGRSHGAHTAGQAKEGLPSLDPGLLISFGGRSPWAIAHASGNATCTQRFGRSDDDRDSMTRPTRRIRRERHGPSEWETADERMIHGGRR